MPLYPPHEPSAQRSLSGMLSFNRIPLSQRDAADTFARPPPIRLSRLSHPVSHHSVQGGEEILSRLPPSTSSHILCTLVLLTHVRGFVSYHARTALFFYLKCKTSCRKPSITPPSPSCHSCGHMFLPEPRHPAVKANVRKSVLVELSHIQSSWPVILVLDSDLGTFGSH